jgi:hypothetical protein
MRITKLWILKDPCTGAKRVASVLCEHRASCAGAASGAHAEDLNQDGYVDLILANYRQVRNLRTTSFIYWNGPEGMSPNRRTELPTEGATGIAVGDINGDGLPDIAFACSSGGATPIFLHGPEGFSGDRLIRLPQASAGVALADVDNDGDLDVILAFESQVTLYLSDGRALGAQPAASLPASDAGGVTASDPNGDGFPELIVSNKSQRALHSCDSYVYWGSKTGYSIERRTDLPTHAPNRSIVGDLNGDGYQDIVFPNTATGHVAGSPIDSYIYLGDANGEFAPHRRIQLAAVQATDAVSADLNEDGFPEVILASNGVRRGGAIEGSPLYWNSPTGFRKEPFNFPVLGARGTGAADFNRDGYLDVVLTNPFRSSEPEYPSHSTFIFWGGPQGYDLDNHHVFSTPHGYRFYLADFDKDGCLDLAIGEMYLSRVSVYWGNAEGKFSAETRMELPTFLCNTVNAADLDGDGYIDLLAGSKGSRENAEEPAFVYWGGAEPGFGQPGGGLFGGAADGAAKQCWNTFVHCRLQQ